MARNPNEIITKVSKGVETRTQYIGACDAEHTWVCWFGGGFALDSFAGKQINGKPIWENHTCKFCGIRKFVTRKEIK